MSGENKPSCPHCKYTGADTSDCPIVNSDPSYRPAPGNESELRKALELAQKYLIDRGISNRGVVGRTVVLPAIAAALSLPAPTLSAEVVEALEEARDLIDDLGDVALEVVTLERRDGVWDKIKAAIRAQEKRS